MTTDRLGHDPSHLVTRLQETEAELRRSASALQQHEEQWHELFVQASDGIFIADLQGRYTEVNGAGCRLLGRERSDIVGKSIADLIPPADIVRLEVSKARMLEGGTHVAEWSLRRGDGSYVPVEVSAKILSDGRWIGLVRDITERKRAQEAAQAMAAELERRVGERTAQLHRLAAELEAAENRERRQLARDLHDDLGQTLAAAQIRLAGVLGDVPETARRALADVAALIDRANRSTRSLAEQLAPATLYELGLPPALEWLGEEIERSFGLRVHVHDDGRPKPLSQETRSILYRATRELLINAAKHAHGAQASIDSRRDGDRVVVRVCDDGVGFDAARPAGAGAGLGLRSVHERLSFIGGTAEVRSVPGEGTVALLCAPIDSAEPSHEESLA
ncbi:MAG TPA: PAS domain S-box protein [Albitalea sp.]|nr:PAS domain S-box protein [Albitalea sp.]